MKVVPFSTVRQKLKEYCDKATEEKETILVTRRQGDDVVIISLEEYQKMLEKLGVKL